MEDSTEVPTAPTGSGGPRRVRIWDLPTRVFHWALAVAVIGSFITAKVGGNAMVWHFRLGYAVAALVAFRFIWGIVGGRWSRFATFVRGPGTLLRYLRGKAAAGEHLDVGHNPLGALSVLALLGLLALQLATGSVADDEIANVGPLNRLVATATAEWATSWHKTAGQYGLAALVVLHVGAVVFYQRWRKRDLLRPMWHGDKHLHGQVPPARDDITTRLTALALLVACAAAVALVLKFGA